MGTTHGLDFPWLEDALGRMREAIVVTDADFDSPGPRIRYVNAAFERMTGWTSAQSIGRSPRFLQCEATDLEALGRIRQALANARPISEVVLNRHRNGTDYWNRLYIQPIRDDNGTVSGFISLQSDVTDERAQGDRLRQISEWFVAATESSPNGKYVLMAVRGDHGSIEDFRVDYANEIGARRLATTREQLIGSLLSAAWPIRFVPGLKAQCLAVLASGQPLSDEFEVTEYGEDIRWIRHQILPVEDGVVINSENISERRIAQAELAQREEWFRAAAEGNLNALFINEAVYDDDGQVVDFSFAYVNEQGGRMLSMNPADMIGKSVFDLFPSYRADGSLERYRELFLEKRSWVGEFPIDSPGIKAKWIRQLAVPWSRGLALSAEDITDSIRERLALSQERKLLQAFVDHFPGAAWIAKADGEIELCNASFSANLQGPLAASTPDPLRPGHDLALASGGTQLKMLSLASPGGAVRQLEVLQFPVDAGDVGCRTGGIALDVTQREQNLESAKLLSALASASHDAVLSVAEDGRVCFWATSAERFYGYPAEAVLGRGISVLAAPESAHRWSEVLAMLVSQGAVRSSRLRHVAVDGRIIDVEVSGAEHGRYGDGLRAFALLVSDISARVQAEQRAEFLAMHEDSSGLLNFKGFKQRTAEHLQRLGQNSEGGFLVARISLLELESLRELFGADFADALFNAFADRARSLFRTSHAILARRGPDQILVFFADATHAQNIFAQMWEKLRQPIDLGDKRFDINAKCGFATGIGLEAETLDTVMRASDIAHGQALTRPGGAALKYEPSMALRLERRGAIQEALSVAIGAGELSLVLQPIFGDYRHPRVTGIEALLRWTSGKLGFVSPSEFIPVAEESNLIVELGDWVLTESCRQLKRIHEAGHPKLNIAVNVAEAQLCRPDFVQWVLEIVSGAGIEPGNLELEITERTLMADTDAGEEMLQAIRRAGMKVSVDDFGTGYSSLSYLADFSVDKLKVDRSFVSQMAESRRHYSLVTAVLNLAKSLRVQCVAEGVETSLQFDMLRTLGCHFFQGYHLAKPMPIEALLPWLDRERVSAVPPVDPDP